MRGSQGLRATTSPALQSSRYAWLLLPSMLKIDFHLLHGPQQLCGVSKQPASIRHVHMKLATC